MRTQADGQTPTRRKVLKSSALTAGAVAVSGLLGVGGFASTASATTESVTQKIDGMLWTIDEIQGNLEPCDSDVCETVLGHSFERRDLTRDAMAAFKKDDWKTATYSLTEVKGIVEADIGLLEGVEDRGSVADVLSLERSLLEQTEATIDDVERTMVTAGANPM